MNERLLPAAPTNEVEDCKQQLFVSSGFFEGRLLNSSEFRQTARTGCSSGQRAYDYDKLYVLHPRWKFCGSRQQRIWQNGGMPAVLRA